MVRPGKVPGIVIGLLFLACLVTAQEPDRPEFIGLSKIAKDLGLKMGPGESEREVRLKGEWVVLDFKAASRIMWLNGLKIFLGNPVWQSRGGLYLSTDDWERLLKPILMPRVVGNSPGYRKVVIDPGHGGKDPGAVNSAMGIQEKDLALAVSRLIAQRLSAEGFEVRLSRRDDRFIPLDDRPESSNRLQADIFLSIHFNAANPSVRGVETFVYTLRGDPSSGRTNVEPVDRRGYPGNANDHWNALLGFYIQSEMVKGTGLPDRGLKRARFTVLEDLDSPGALLELGFLSNSQTALLLKQPAFLNRLADAVTQGVLRYRRTLMRLETSP
ncbi:MAG: N-acetylmuramoyl-L-alanine amidase [Verrucomicrobiota bacterium]